MMDWFGRVAIDLAAVLFRMGGADALMSRLPATGGRRGRRFDFTGSRCLDAEPLLLFGALRQPQCFELWR